MKTKPKQIAPPKEKITRKEALIKTSKYAAFTAVGMMILSPKKSQAQSLPGGPGGKPW